MATLPNVNVLHTNEPHKLKTGKMEKKCCMTYIKHRCPESSACVRVKKWEASEVRLGRKRATHGLDSELERMERIQGRSLGNLQPIAL